MPQIFKAVVSHDGHSILTTSHPAREQVARGLPQDRWPEAKLSCSQRCFWPKERVQSVTQARLETVGGL